MCSTFFPDTDNIPDMIHSWKYRIYLLNSLNQLWLKISLETNMYHIFDTYYRYSTIIRTLEKWRFCLWQPAFNMANGLCTDCILNAVTDFFKLFLEQLQSEMKFIKLYWQWKTFTFVKPTSLTTQISNYRDTIKKKSYWKKKTGN